MEIRPLTDSYAVSPQVAPEDLSAVKAAGYVTVICNRPDQEIPPEFQADAIRKAAEAHGLAFVLNPVVHGALTLEIVETQGKTIAEAPGPVLAYCASGNRSSIVWALSQAGKVPTDDLIAAGARYGYVLEPYREQINRLAVR